MIIQSFRTLPAYDRLRARLPGPGEERLLSSLPGSSAVVLAAALAGEQDTPNLLLVAGTAGDADEVEADLDVLVRGGARVFPQREAVHPEQGDPHVEISARRVEALQSMLAGRARIVVTTGRALSERFAVPRSWEDLEIQLSRAQRIDRDALIRRLERSGYARVSMVEAVGEFAVRGGIMDVFPVTTLDPVRIEFWGDRIESIRSFDVLDQRSIEQVESVRALPIRFPNEPDVTDQGAADTKTRRSLLDILPESTLIMRLQPDAEESDRRRSWEELQRRSETPERYQYPADSVGDRLGRYPVLRVRAGGPEGDLDFGIRPPDPIDRRIERLVDSVHRASEAGASVLILCDNDGQAERLDEILDETVDPRARRDVTLGIGPVAGGFVLEASDPPLWVFTDHEIFRRARRPRARPRQLGRSARESLSILEPGDYVVHMDHGIGRFRGLERVKIGQEELETFVIEYAGGDVLRVPHYRADLIERWISDPEGDGPRPEPRLHRLGGKGWQRLKKRTRDAIQTMAAELLELYAARQVADGRSFAPDTRWQREMESAFLYEDTPDQEKATAEVKRDMESPRPTDRLICGDVGYGKTEVAIRAAFKAVQDGVQVALLAPTTVLVEQHLQTFRARLAEYPVRIESLSRFRTPQQQQEIVEGVARGSIDIVIGTHRLLSPDIEFKELGLLIVDEEQRFGVAQKEQLKAMKRSVDVLSMTATPIPRTLHLSLSGLRDLSIIRTPPRNRRPVITHVMTWNDRMIEDAIRREVDRGGQVFFVHNRVETIEEIAAKVRRHVPDLRVEVAHGQMPERDLEQVMTDFVRGAIDVLVATSIVENGLDVPNANTMIVSRADYFGLAQLYQLRGRVGRSHQRAFCYLIVPPNLAPETERRLRLLEQHTELGAGYRIALKDLELRGAGNLLGAEQSGFAQAVGFDTYIRLLQETVRAMQRDDHAAEPGTRQTPEVSISGASYIPDDFIPDEIQKLDLYRRLSKVDDLDELAQLADELRDRFGRLPGEVERLIAVARVRILGAYLGVERVLATSETARINFRRGIVPRLSVLKDSFAERYRDVEVEVRRLQPLSLVLRQPDATDVTPLLSEALERLLEEKRELVSAG